MSETSLSKTGIELTLATYQLSNHYFICVSWQGDSGGALICRGESNRWQAEGIISWGGQCGQPGQPGVYTRLRHYVTWIRDVTTPSREYIQI